MLTIDSNNLIQFILYGGLIIALIVSAVSDLYRRRIPNVVTYPTIFTALLTYCFIAGWDGLLFSLGGLAFGFVVFLIPYLMGGIGAGDVKLMAAVGAVLGFKQTIVALFFVAIAGGLIALALIVYRRRVKETFSRIFMLFLFRGVKNDASLQKSDKDELTQDGIPFGVAITSGVCLFFIYLVINKEALPVVGVL